MKRRNILINFRIGGLKCLFAIVLPLALISHAQAAVDLLDYWNFNNATAGSPGSFNTTNVHGVELYDSGTKTLSPSSGGIKAADSLVDFNGLYGAMGTNWGTYSGIATNSIPSLDQDTTNQSFAVIGTVQNDKYIDIVLNSTGYKDLSISFASRSTSTGVATETWQYSTNSGTTWDALSTLAMTRDSNWYLKGIDGSSVTATDDQADLRFRVIFTGDSGSSGTHRIDNLQIKGITLSTATLTWNPSVGANTWNTNPSNNNWLNGLSPSAYTAGDVVEFTNSGLANGSTINVTPSLDPGEMHVKNTTGTYTFAGSTLSGGGPLTKTGSGAVNFAVDSAATYSGDISISAGTLQVDNDYQLTSGKLQLNGGALQRTSSGSLTFHKDISFTSPSTIDTNGGDLELAGYLTSPYSGASTMTLTKVGSGILTLSQPDANPPGYFHGNTEIQAGTIRLNAVNVSGYTAIGDGSIRVRDGGMLQIDNITNWIYGNSTYGDYSYIDLYKGSTLLGTGANARINDPTKTTGDLSIVMNATSDPSNIVNLKTSGTSDVLTISTSLKQFSTTSNYTAPTNATIRVSGPGRVVLQSGGISSRYTFGGDWQLDSGVLQIGPVEPNYTPLPDPGYNGPHGEPLNALGFKVPTGAVTGTNTDPDLPNAITITGGILAVAVDAPNTNPSNTEQPVNFTPNYLRNPVILAGGAIASTGEEVTYNGLGQPQGVPNGNPVVARLGGNFTVALGTSKVLTYDPSNTSAARTVELVGGTRTITNDSPAFNANDVITYSTSWIGTLQVDAGGTSGGSFNINRIGGTVSVTPGAELDILAGATVNLSGANALSDGTDSVNIVNNGDFDVLNGNHQVGAITGNGSVMVEDDTTLAVQSIITGGIRIGPGAKLIIMPSTGGPLAGDTSFTAVPEPSALVLLSLAGLVGLFRMYFRIKR